MQRHLTERQKLHIVAGIAGCEMNTVTKFLRGEKVRRSNKERIVAAMKEIGWELEITEPTT